MMPSTLGIKIVNRGLQKRWPTWSGSRVFQVVFSIPNCIAGEGIGQALRYDLTDAQPGFPRPLSQEQALTPHARAYTHDPGVTKSPRRSC